MLLIQALLFGDGGILAFGANCFNMAFVLPFLGYFVFKFVRERSRTRLGEYAGISLGAYFGMAVAALCAAVEFGVQPLLFHTASGQPLYCPYPLSVSIPAMLIPHLAAACVVEVLFTLLIYTFVKRVSPDLLPGGAPKKSKAVWGLLGALVCLTPLGLLATGAAWGEWSADEISSIVSGGNALGYVPEGMKTGFQFGALLPDYSVSGLPEELGYLLSAVLGAALLVIIFKVAGSFAREKSS